MSAIEKKSDVYYIELLSGSSKRNDFTGQNKFDSFQYAATRVTATDGKRLMELDILIEGGWKKLEAEYPGTYGIAKDLDRSEWEGFFKRRKELVYKFLDEKREILDKAKKLGGEGIRGNERNGTFYFDAKGKRPFESGQVVDLHELRGYKLRRTPMPEEPDKQKQPAKR